MRYKHITDLDYSEKSILFNLKDDILEQAIVKIANEEKEDKIEHNKIREEFNNILESKDIIIDTKTYSIYERID